MDSFLFCGQQRSNRREQKNERESVVTAAKFLTKGEKYSCAVKNTVSHALRVQEQHRARGREEPKHRTELSSI